MTTSQYAEAFGLFMNHNAPRVIASASTLGLDPTDSFDTGYPREVIFTVTGTTGISTISAPGHTKSDVFLVFTDAVTLTHSDNLVLPGAVDYTTVAGEILKFRNQSPVFNLVAAVPAFDLSGALALARGNPVEVASAATLTLTNGATDWPKQQGFKITGTTGISEIKNADRGEPRSVAHLLFQDGATLTHSSALELPGGVDLDVEAGQIVGLFSSTTTRNTWRLVYVVGSAGKISELSPGTMTPGYSWPNGNLGYGFGGKPSVSGLDPVAGGSGGGGGGGGETNVALGSTYSSTLGNGTGNTTDELDQLFDGNTTTSIGLIRPGGGTGYAVYTLPAESTVSKIRVKFTSTAANVYVDCFTTPDGTAVAPTINHLFTASIGWVEYTPGSPAAGINGVRFYCENTSETADIAEIELIA